MPRYFTRGTPLFEMEVMMVAIPNFTKRNFRDICSCRYCSYYSKKKGCKCSACPYIAERLETGLLDYKGLLSETFYKKLHVTPKMKHRIDTLTKNTAIEMFISCEHRDRFYSVLHRVKAIYCSPDNPYVAALYLLTTHSKLWNVVRSQVYAKKIYFENIRLCNLDTECYAYYQMARMLYDNIPRITVSEMTDTELIEDDVFKTLIHATLIQLYGIEVLSF